MRPIPRELEPHADAAQFEERCLAAVLMLAGAIGLAIGAFAPRTHGTELVLGALLLGLGAWTLLLARARGEQ